MQKDNLSIVDSNHFHYSNERAISSRKNIYSVTTPSVTPTNITSTRVTPASATLFAAFHSLPKYLLSLLLTVTVALPFSAHSALYDFAGALKLDLADEVTAFQKAKLETAGTTEKIETLHKKSLSGNDFSLIIQSGVLLADAYVKNAAYDKALAALRRLVGVKDIEKKASAGQLALLYYHFARLNQLVGAYSTATQYYQLARGKAKSNNSQQAEAIINNDLGNTLLVNAQKKEAIDAFLVSFNIFQNLGQRNRAIEAGLNLVRASAGVSAESDVSSALERVEKLITGQQASAIELLALSDLYRKIQRQYKLPASLRRKSFDFAQQALQLARQQKDLTQQSYALGFSGRLMEDEARLDDALTLTTQAIFKAQEANAMDSLYQWQWQEARLLKARSDNNGAINSYIAAVETLSKIRSQLLTHVPGAFEERIGPVYYGLLDLLLQQTSRLKDNVAIENNLRTIRQLLEQFKVSEVEDYFRNDCVIQPDDSSIANLKEKPAVIYPIILDDRLDILVSFPAGLKLYSSPVTRKDLVESIRLLRLNIEKPGSKTVYQEQAGKLYQWIVAPLKAELDKQKVKTLVFIPDGSLRSIPMAVLYDGTQHLVEQYALATTPGLSLTNVDTMSKNNLQFLVNGITEAVQGFNALPFVDNEIKNINQLFPTKVYMDKKFVESNVEKEMKQGDYNIVHVATHGQFSPNHTESFLLTYNGKLSMDDLENSIGIRRFVNKPLDLLVLSACQSAAGDDRAALGLAGVAIKAGARSAIATLWFINDKATAILMSDFYKNLKQQQSTKAQALRTAQLKLLNSPKYRHPAYWAPFLMIGNWL